MMKKYILFSAVLLLIPLGVFGQIGGERSFSFLDLTNSARATALNGATMAVMDFDVSFAYVNPALLNQKMDQQLSFNHNFHFADISSSYFAFGKHLSSSRITLHGGVTYSNFGNFGSADEFGNQGENFSAKDIALSLGAGKQLNERIRAGINLRYIHSQLEIYDAKGIGADIGLLYTVPDKQLNFGLTIRNLGIQLDGYSMDKKGLPLDVQLGLSKRFAHLPFRLSITAHHLNHWDLRYDLPKDLLETDIFGNVIESQGGFGSDVDNFFRHLIFAGEFLFGKSDRFRFRLSYNHQRRKELSVSTFRSLGGFGFGFGLKIKKIRFDYGLGYYHLAGSTQHVSLSTNLNDFRKKL